MTLYLWHIPPLLAMHLFFDYLGHPRYDAAAPGFIVLSIVWLVIMAVLVATVFVVLRPLENNPLPLWDGGYVAAAGSAQWHDWRAAVRRRCGHAGVGRLGPQGPWAVLRRGDAGDAGLRPVSGHRPAPRRSARLRRQPACEHEVGGCEAALRVRGYPLLRRNSRRLSSGPCAFGCLFPPSR